MDEKKIKDALHKMDIPAHDENAQKRALNLAMAEFEAIQKNNEKKSQGNSILARLMSRTQQNKGHTTMETKQKKKMIYGGMATAMAVVLIAGVSFTQLQSGIFDQSDVSLNYLSAAPDMTQAPGTQSASPAYVDAIQDVNQSNWAEAVREGSSAIPIPIAPPVGRIEVQGEQRQTDPVQVYRNQTPSTSRTLDTTDDTTNESSQNIQLPQAYSSVEEENEDPLQRWRRLQGERTFNQISEQLNKLAQNNVPLSDDIKSKIDSLKDADISTIEGSKQTNEVLVQLLKLDHDKFEEFKINPVKLAAEEPVSTFSVDVDTASYSFMRRQIEHGQMPGSDTIRVEELINYFDYNYAAPDDKDVPFKANVTVTPSPWADGKELVHIGLKGYEMDTVQPRSNLVFLLDVSGSMNAPDKLPLLKSSLGLLLDTLKPDDTVSIATYAGSTGVALEPTKASEKSKILSALDNLRAGGSTAGAAGIELAYNLAAENFDEEAVNRVILATDGDFNVGINDPEKLKSYIEDKRESGIFLSVLGFGQGNYNDHIMQSLAQNGNGIAAYIDNLNEAQKVLVDEATSSLFPIAKDVKIQVEFNPETVAEYRLIGYETRALNREDFNNDKIDAGDIGAGHTVTAIYEITPVGSEARSIDELRYGEAKTTQEPSDFSGEYAFLKMRYKLPNEDISKLITTPITAGNDAAISPDVKFSLAVAAFGQILKGGDYTGDYSYDDVLELAQDGKGADPYGYRAEFIKLVRLAKSLDQ